MGRDRDDRDHYVTIRQAADAIGIDPSTARRGLERMGARPFWVPCRYFAGQVVLAVTREDLDRFLDHRRSRGLAVRPGEGPAAPAAFYAVQVAPDLEPRRVKLGLSRDPAGRLAGHRGAAPTARALGSWPCRPAWERAAIASITRAGVLRALSVEVFEFDDLAAMLARAEAFFALMPGPGRG